MERRLSLLFGIVASIILIYLNNIPSDRIPIDGFVIRFILGLFSFIGLIFAIYFSVFLIIDAIKSIYKNKDV